MPCAARIMAGTVVISSSTMIRGFVRRTYAVIVSRTSRRRRLAVASLVGRRLFGRVPRAPRGVGTRWPGRRASPRSAPRAPRAARRPTGAAWTRRSAPDRICATNRPSASVERHDEVVRAGRHRARPDRDPEHQQERRRRQHAMREHRRRRAAERRDQPSVHQRPVGEHEAGRSSPDVRPDQEQRGRGAGREQREAGETGDRPAAPSSPCGSFTRRTRSPPRRPRRRRTRAPRRNAP